MVLGLNPTAYIRHKIGNKIYFSFWLTFFSRGYFIFFSRCFSLARMAQLFSSLAPNSKLFHKRPFFTKKQFFPRKYLTYTQAVFASALPLATRDCCKLSIEPRLHIEKLSILLNAHQILYECFHVTSFVRIADRTRLSRGDRKRRRKNLRLYM